MGTTATPRLTSDLVRAQARARPNALAVAVDGGRRMSFGELDATTDRLAAGLVDLGVAPQDRVVVLASNDDAVDAVVAHFAIHKAGAVAVPLNTRMPAAELASTAKDAGARAGLATASFRGNEATRALDECLELGLGIASGPPRACEGWPDLVERGRGLADGPASGGFQVPLDEGAMADLLPTSGTTGRPKYVATTHKDALSLARNPLPFPDSTYLHAVPLFTFTGAQALTFLPLASGMCQLVQSPFDPGRFLELLREATATFLVPAMAVLCMKHDSFASLDAPDLKLVMLGTAATPPSAILAWAKQVPGASLLNLYGLTEGGGAVCAIGGRELLEHPNAAGRPVPPAELKVVREDGTECEPGEPGEVLLRQPGIRRSYIGDPEGTTTTFDDDGFVHTGDVGYVDDTGLLFVVDRMKDLVIRGGFNISSAEVEDALLELPEVLEAAVVGVDHEVLGEDVAAFVVRAPDAQVEAEELRRHLASRLADYKVPRRIFMVDSLPRNPTGKVRKTELRKEASRLVAKEADP
jgi:fatty-acyl-CoA synthase